MKKVLLPRAQIYTTSEESTEQQYETPTYAEMALCKATTEADCNYNDVFRINKALHIQSRTN